MLKFLSITNLAVIQRLNIELHEGLNLLTGETGAGKSIIVDALVLMLGRRGGADMIRTGERFAGVEGVFSLNGVHHGRVVEILEEAGIEFKPSEELLIRREIQAGGRNRIFVNDQSITAATLRSLQPSLVEIHGQGEQHALAVSQSHLQLLDSFAGCEDLRRETARSYSRWKTAVEALKSLRRDELERERVSDYLRYQISEIDKVGLTPGEDVELAAERELLVHAERALELCAQSYAELYESDQSVLTQIASVRRRIQDLALIDRRVEGWLELIETATALLTEVAEGVRGFGSGVDFSPERLGEVENRLASIERLKRKYGREVEGLISLQGELNEQLGRLNSLAEREVALNAEVEAAKDEYSSLAKRLTKIRRAAAPQLEMRVMEELQSLALERARFIVSVETADNVGDETSEFVAAEASDNVSGRVYWSPNGADRVEFLLSANVGENPRPLARVASGGELSRLMLALRTVCRRSEGELKEPSDVVTLVFDEVDTGIGGRTAEAVGRRLKALASRQQVLCVTHQPQIARFADHHYAVSKWVEGGRTMTTVKELGADERVGELARMIGGAEDIETARETARWMLTPNIESSRQEKSQKGAKVKKARGGKERSEL